MELHVSIDHLPDSLDEFVHLSRVGHAHSICDTDAIHTQLVNLLVDLEQIDQI